MRYFKAIAGITIVVAIVTSVLLADSVPRSMVLDAPELAALHEQGTAIGVSDLVPGGHAGDCGNHSGGPDCPSCPSCSGIPASGNIVVIASLAESASGHTARLAQAPLRRELPPPRRA